MVLDPDQTPVTSTDVQTGFGLISRRLAPGVTAGTFPSLEDATAVCLLPSEGWGSGQTQSNDTAGVEFDAQTTVASCTRALRDSSGQPVGLRWCHSGKRRQAFSNPGANRKQTALPSWPGIRHPKMTNCHVAFLGLPHGRGFAPGAARDAMASRRILTACAARSACVEISGEHRRKSRARVT